MRVEIDRFSKEWFMEVAWFTICINYNNVFVRVAISGLFIFAMSFFGRSGQRRLDLKMALWYCLPSMWSYYFVWLAIWHPRWNMWLVYWVIADVPRMIISCRCARQEQNSAGEYGDPGADECDAVERFAINDGDLV